MRRWWPIASLLVLCLALLLWRSGAAPVASPVLVDDDKDKRSPSLESPSAPTPAGTVAAEVREESGFNPPQRVIDQGPLIGNVTLEKTTVCPGEDMKISMSPLVSEPGTIFNVEGAFGGELILKATLAHEEDFWVVAANGDKRDFRKVTVKVLSPTDRLCLQGPAVSVTAKPRAGAPEVYTFQAAVVRGLKEPLRVTWSFGDGSGQQAGALVQHSYTARPQTSMASSFIVTADVTDARGRLARGRASVSLHNTYYQARVLTGDRPLPVDYDRFPKQGDRAHFTANLMNIESQPVMLDQAVVRLRPCEASGSATERLVAAADLLSEAELPPGKSSRVTITLDSRWVGPEVCQVDLTLLGDTDPPTTGEPMAINGIAQKDVTVEMSLQLGMPKPVELGGNPEMAVHEVTDPEVVKRLVAIMTARGTNHMTEDELTEAMASAHGSD